MILRVRLVIGAIFLICLPLFSQESLKGNVYRTFDFRIVEMNFYDDTLCVCTQSFYFPMPHEPMCKVDTFAYHVENSHLYLEVPSAPNRTVSRQTLCADYLMYGFFFSRFVMRDGKPLLRYPISLLDIIGESRMQATKASWVEWTGNAEGVFRYEDILTMNGGLILYRTAGAPYKYADRSDEEIPESICEEYGCVFPCNEELKYKLFEIYRWFSRPRAVLSTEETLTGIMNKRYIYATDTLLFRDDMSCVLVQHDSLPKRCAYRVEGANVLISGLDENLSDVVDTLVYDNHVLYHGSVTQYANIVDREAAKGKMVVGFRQPTALELNPTADMSVRAFVLDGAEVSDEQIGKTFQSVYIPLNFHSKVSHLLKGDENNPSQSL